MAISFGVPTNLAVSGALTVGGTATVASTLTLSSTTASSLLYGNASKGVSSVVLSSNLTLTTGTLALAADLTGVNSITAAAGQNATLSGGSSGASLVLGQGGISASSTLTNTGTGSFSVVNGDTANVLILSRNTLTTNTGTAIKFRSKDDGGTYVDIADFYAAKSVATAGAVSSFISWGTRRAGTLTDAMMLTATGNLLIGTTTDISGSGGFSALRGKVGGSGSVDSIFHVYESSAAGTGNGITVEQAGAGDAAIQFLLTGVQRWSAGIDNSDSDAFVLSAGALGSSNRLRIATNGDASFLSTTASTSTTSGSGIFGGGIGVAGDSNIGGNIGIGSISASNTARKVIRLNEGGYADPAAPGSTSYGDKIILQDPGASYRSAIGFNGSGHTWFQGAAFAWWTGAAPTNVMSLSAGGALSTASYLDASGGVGTPAAGHAQYGGSGSYGASIIGNGSAYDFGLFNKNGTDVMRVATGGTTVAFAGAINAGGAVNAVGVGSTGGFSNTVSGDSNLRLTSSTAVTGRDWYVRSTSTGIFDLFDNTGGGRRFSISSTGAVDVPSTTSATSSTSGALTIGNGTAATNVAIGGGNINAGGTLTAGDTITMRKDGTAAAFVNGVILNNQTTTGAVTQYFTDDNASASYTRFVRYGSAHATKAGVFEIGHAGTGYVSLTSTTPSTGVGTGALQVAGGIYAGAASVFGGSVTVGGTINTTNNGWSSPASGAGQLASTSTAGVQLSGKGSTNDITLVNSVGGTVLRNPTGTQDAVFAGVTILKNYTVDRLPDAASYAFGTAFVSDATNAAGTGAGTAPTGGGAVVRLVYCTGAAWLLV